MEEAQQLDSMLVDPKDRSDIHVSTLQSSAYIESANRSAYPAKA